MIGRTLLFVVAAVFVASRGCSGDDDREAEAAKTFNNLKWNDPQSLTWQGVENTNGQVCDIEVPRSMADAAGPVLANSPYPIDTRVVDGGWCAVDRAIGDRVISHDNNFRTVGVRLKNIEPDVGEELEGKLYDSENKVRGYIEFEDLEFNDLPSYGGSTLLPATLEDWRIEVTYENNPLFCVKRTPGTPSEKIKKNPSVHTGPNYSIADCFGH